MPFDEGPRPNPPEQRHEAPPRWWDQLGRGDLPDDLGHRRVMLELEPAPEPARLRPALWVTVAGIVVVLVLAGIILAHVMSAHDVAVGLVVFAIPAIAAGCAAIAVMRHLGD
jgi:hypothetical protein